MFHNARLKLTAWYLLIIMLISISFSVVLFRELFGQVQWFTHEQEARFQRRLEIDFAVDPVTYVTAMQNIRSMNNILMSQASKRLVVLMFLINGGIFILAGLLGYVLAGKTLKPIQDMVDDQNRFISDASHELRTPLTALKSSMEVYLRGKKPTLSEAKEVVTSGIEDVDKLQALSESLLQVTQYQKFNENIPFTQVGLSGVVQGALRRVKPMAKLKGIRINDRTEDAALFGNSLSLTDLLVILLDNAVKYSHEKSTVTVGSKIKDGMAEIRVEDEGIGIEKKDIEKIFDRFYRADGARARTGSNGYGLGLSIAQGIATLHRGNIIVKSTAGKGTVFTVRIPLARNTR